MPNIPFKINYHHGQTSLWMTWVFIKCSTYQNHTVPIYHHQNHPFLGHCSSVLTFSWEANLIAFENLCDRCCHVSVGSPCQWVCGAHIYRANPPGTGLGGTESTQTGATKSSPFKLHLFHLPDKAQPCSEGSATNMHKAGLGFVRQMSFDYFGGTLQAIQVILGELANMNEKYR